MEQDELLTMGVGNKEAPKLGPAKVTIVGVIVQRENKEGEKLKTPLVNFLVKHPGTDEPIKMTKVKLIVDDKVKVLGMWAQVDEDNQIQKGSTLADVLSFLRINQLNDAVGKEMDAVLEAEGGKYLCLKAY